MQLDPIEQLYKLFCRESSFRTALYKLDPVLFWAKRLCWNSCKWDGVDSYAAKDEDDAWNYAGEIPGFHEEYIRQAKELLALARKAVNE